jgi:endonuclease-3
MDVKVKNGEKFVNGKRSTMDAYFSVSETPKKPVVEPKYWREALRAIQQMRSERLAPVDTMGCHRLGDGAEDPKARLAVSILPVADGLDGQVFRYHILTGLMLSSQTKDPVTAAAVANLKCHGLTVEKIRQTPVEVIDRLICKVGFHGRKAQYVCRCKM